jgi:cytochrome P450
MQTKESRAEQNLMHERSVAAFDPLMDHSDEFLKNPYPALNALRDQAPVSWSERGRQWLVAGHEEALQTMRSNICGKRIERWKHPNLLMRLVIHFRSRTMRSMLIEDPPEHTRLRSLVNSAFTPAVVQQLELRIQEIAENLIAEFRTDSSAELVSQYAFVLPVTVIAELLGVPAADRARFKDWSTQITAGFRGKFCPMLITRSLAANHGLSQYLKQIIKEKKQRPQHDLISALLEVQSQNDGRLSERELLANSLLLLLAGHETTVNLIGNGLYNLLQAPEQLRLLKENPSLINNAVEEFLRYDPPVQFVRRVAYKDFQLSDKTIRKDDILTVLISPANRDPRVFSEPDRMNIQRQNSKHISFGSGIHHCLGAELARTEARIAIMTLLDKLPDLRLDQNEAVEHRGPFLLRGLKTLPVSY